MVKSSDYKVGSIIILKKTHPSKTIEWEVIRIGLDIKLKSTTVPDTYIIMSRIVFNKKVKEIK
ncbi:MAG: DUF951 domain-containing protein [Mycoplasma sp.]|nr:DUF951 domain-containing protein [Mycoplasma sp.]